MFDDLIDLGESSTWFAISLATLGALGSFWYAGYLGTGAGLFMKILSAVITFVIGYVVALFILNR